MKTTINLHEVLTNDDYCSDYVYIYREESQLRSDKNCTRQHYVCGVTVRVYNDDNYTTVKEVYNMISGKTIRREKRRKIERIVKDFHNDRNKD